MGRSKTEIKISPAELAHLTISETPISETGGSKVAFPVVGRPDLVAVLKRDARDDDLLETELHSLNRLKEANIAVVEHYPHLVTVNQRPAILLKRYAAGDRDESFVSHINGRTVRSRRHLIQSQLQSKVVFSDPQTLIGKNGKLVFFDPLDVRQGTAEEIKIMAFSVAEALGQIFLNKRVLQRELELGSDLIPFEELDRFAHEREQLISAIQHGVGLRAIRKFIQQGTPLPVRPQSGFAKLLFRLRHGLTIDDAPQQEPAKGIDRFLRPGIRRERQLLIQDK